MNNKKYKLTIRIRYGLEERDFGVYEIEGSSFSELFFKRELSVFKDDSYIVCYIEEIDEQS